MGTKPKFYARQIPVARPEITANELGRFAEKRWPVGARTDFSWLYASFVTGHAGLANATLAALHAYGAEACSAARAREYVAASLRALASAVENDIE